MSADGKLPPDERPGSVLVTSEPDAAVPYPHPLPPKEGLLVPFVATHQMIVAIRERRIE